MEKDTAQRLSDEVLQTKWKQVFYMLDIDGDGLWTKTDSMIMQNRLVANSNMPPDKQNDVSKLTEEIYENLGKNETLTESEFISQIRRQFDEGTLEDMIRMIRRRIFYCVDLDNDGQISMKEFCVWHEITGKEAFDFDKAFKCIDTDGNGDISMEEYLDAYVTYFCDASVTLDDMPLYGVRKN